ncbi:MAG: NADH-quinone oxidoreductase subunit L [Pirellulales bacterium]|nr:NADH-quinone oxidoreductase subunit L [Pirellulales bacterium]
MQGLADILPILLGAAWLLPLVSFVVIVFLGPRLGKAGVLAGYVASGAILGSFVLSAVAMLLWLGHHWPAGTHHEAHGAESHAADEHHAAGDSPKRARLQAVAFAADDAAPATHAADEHAAGADHGLADEHAERPAYAGTWYTMASFGPLELSVGYYIDALTVAMFTMVSLIATCIHFYATGYMHDELHDVTDHEVRMSDGRHLHRPGRYYRFFQYLSLFCFSMLGLVVSGNVFMVFMFWELVGICSYFLIGFYIERKSASTAANKAFIVNRVGDFGMIIGLMALWGSLGTLAFGDLPVVAGGKGDNSTATKAVRPGIFSLVRPAENHHALTTPDGMVRSAAAAAGVTDNAAAAEAGVVNDWRQQGLGYGLLVVAGLGIFCGCVGKSAQFPLHVWLPDAMEGPTPVSALVHSATMVAAGVYLVGRFYPVFTPEVLLVIAYTGGITLLMAATIAITATDIKRVLAYSTVSQLGYMMLALGAGGWLAGMLHLFTHAFFKSLLFLCSGSVIHAVHTNDMRQMGGLRSKMPYTAYTMLVGCLAIAGAGIPFLIGFSGYYSKDAIIAQLISFRNHNSGFHGVLFYVAAAGAATTAFYMFRLWYLTFAGRPRDHERYHHAHESPKVMYVPLMILATLAIVAAWTLPGTSLSLANVLEQARPAGEHGAGRWWTALVVPAEHLSHLGAVHVEATLIATIVAIAGFTLATVMYGLGVLNPDDVRQQFPRTYAFLRDKWYFDELYDYAFVRPTMLVSRLVAGFDKRWIDGFIDSLARWTRGLANIDDTIDRYLVDGLINRLADWTYGFGLYLRNVQTGRLREYVMLIAVGTVALFVLATFAVGLVLAG